MIKIVRGLLDRLAHLGGWLTQLYQRIYHLGDTAICHDRLF